MFIPAFISNGCLTDISPGLMFDLFSNFGELSLYDFPWSVSVASDVKVTGPACARHCDAPHSGGKSKSDSITSCVRLFLAPVGALPSRDIGRILVHLRGYSILPVSR